MSLLLLAIGGVCGALSRYHMVRLVQTRTRSQLPTGTLLINLTGSLVLGLLAGTLPRLGDALASDLGLLLGTGFCGAYTTFSSFGWDTVALWRGNRRRASLLNLFGQPLLGSLAVWIGLMLAIQLGR